MPKTRIIQVRVDETLADTVDWLKTQPGGISWYINNQLKLLDNWRKTNNKEVDHD